MTVELDDPGAYGRIVRDDAGDIEGIVETKDPPASPRTSWPSTRSTPARTRSPPSRWSSASISWRTTTPPASTTSATCCRCCASRASASPPTSPPTQRQPRRQQPRRPRPVTAEARHHILERHMLAGRHRRRPRLDLDRRGVEIGADVTIEPAPPSRATTVAADAIIGPHSTVIDSRVGVAARVLHSYLVEADVGDEATVGPFAYLRPNAALDQGEGRHLRRDQELAHRAGAKVPHLAYVGDAEIGAGANVGAGTITANYDGRNKHPTKIGEGARISVNTSLVAPVTVGDGAYTGAGAVIREDVPDGALGSPATTNATSRATRSEDRARPKRKTGAWTDEHGRRQAAAGRDAAGRELDPARLHEADDGLRRPRVDGASRRASPASSTSTSVRSTCAPSPTARSTAATRNRSAARTSSSSSRRRPTPRRA